MNRSPSTGWSMMPSSRSPASSSAIERAPDRLARDEGARAVDGVEHPHKSAGARLKPLFFPKNRVIGALGADERTHGRLGLAVGLGHGVKGSLALVDHLRLLAEIGLDDRARRIGEAVRKSQRCGVDFGHERIYRLAADIARGPHEKRSGDGRLNRDRLGLREDFDGQGLSRVRKRAQTGRCREAHEGIRRESCAADFRCDRSGGGGRGCCEGCRRTRQRNAVRPCQQCGHRGAGAAALFAHRRIQKPDRGQSHRAIDRDAGVRAAARRGSRAQRQTGAHRDDVVHRRQECVSLQRSLSRLEIRARRHVGEFAPRACGLWHRRDPDPARRDRDADLGQGRSARCLALRQHALCKGARRS